MRTRAAAGIVGALWIYALTALAAASAAEQRYALVIGNAAYRTAPLETPRNDAELIAKALTQVGFSVTRVFDADHKTMKRSLLDFSRKLSDARTVGLFYYAGHAIDLNGTNHLIPIGARIESEADFAAMTVNVTDFLETMERGRRGLNLFIFDANRTSPFQATLRVARGGLSRVGVPSGSLVAYAAEPAQVGAASSGANSLFSASLAKAIVKPDLGLEEVFADASRDVEAQTSGRQIPWWRSSFFGKFSFSQPDQLVLAGDTEAAPGEDGAGGLKASESHSEPGEQSLAAETPASEDTPAVPDIQQGIVIPPSGQRLNEALQKAPVTECDVLAASPADGGRVSKPVPYAKLAREAVKAVEACRIAVARHPGISRLEFQLALSLHADKQYGEAVAWYQKAARRSYPVAMFNLGLIYDQGEAIGRDHAKANAWYRKAAGRGQGSAMWNLAINLDEGKGGGHDGTGAATYLLKALKAGHKKAQGTFKAGLRGWKNTTRTEVQRLLQQAGYYKGTIDGRFDGATLAAATAYIRGNRRLTPQQTAAATQNAPAGRKTPVHDCDRLAASAIDDERVGSAVPYDTLKKQASQAISACREATTKFPGISRFEFQLGMALHAADQAGRAAAWFKKAAKNDHTAAMYNLALLYDDGKGLEQDQGLANFWYRKAADKNQVSAMWNLAINLDEGKGSPHNPGISAKYLLNAYRAGHEKAGKAFEKGLKDWQQSTRREVEQLLKQAGHYDGPVDGGFNEAARAAATVYAGKSPEHAAQQAKPAAPQTQPQATTVAQSTGLHQCDRLAADPGDADRLGDPVLTETLKSQVSTAISACRRAASEYPKTPRFAYQLGRALYVNDEKVEALTWYSKAAEAGYTAATYNLAVAYDLGDGVGKNQEFANEMYRKAAGRGSSSAMWNLAINLDTGAGGDTDPAGAAQFLLKAFLAEHPKAHKTLSSDMADWKETTRQELQRTLQKEGHYRGPVNGRMDAETQSALAAYAQGSGVRFGAAQTTEQPSETPAEQPSETPVEQPSEAPAEQPSEAPAAERNEAPAAEPAPPVTQFVDIHDCDRLAAHPADNDRIATAVLIGTLKNQLARAISACRQATSEYPGVSRFEFQLGRALSADKKDQEAVTWYAKAAERDYTAAMYNLALTYDEGSGIAKDPETANEWYRRAADKGRVSAMWNLAINLDDGLGGARDGKVAAKYLLLAYASGHRKAVEAFDGGLDRWNQATRVEVQRILKQEGYYKGKFDGAIDTGTRTAAQAYRADR